MKSMTDEQGQVEGLTKFEVMVLREIDETKKAVQSLTTQVGKLKVNQREIKIKSSLWGALSAAIVSIGTVTGSFLFRYFVPLSR